MKKIIKLRSKIIYSTLVALGLSLSSLSHSQYLFTPPKAKSAEILQLYLSQQRIQAGLQSKTLKVGDVTWSYSEGGAKQTLDYPDSWTGRYTRQLESCRPVLTPYYHVIIPDLPSNGDTRVPADFDLSVPNVTSHTCFCRNPED